MKRSVVAAIVLIVLGILQPERASSQISIDVSVGTTVPTDAFGEIAKVGWIGLLGVAMPVGDAGLSVGARGFFGSNGHERPSGDSSDLFGAFGEVEFALPTDGSLLPYVFSGLGIMTRSYRSESYPALESRRSGLALRIGAGVEFPLRSLHGIVDAWWLTGSGDLDGTQLFGLTLGVGFPVGEL